jgi:hypothetical protein
VNSALRDTKAIRSYLVIPARKDTVMQQAACHQQSTNPLAVVLVRTTPLDEPATNVSRTPSIWMQEISLVAFSASAVELQGSAGAPTGIGSKSQYQRSHEAHRTSSW